MALNNAIVCLTRGYTDTARYKDLITRNVAIWSHINRECEYPLVIFHEGNISQAHQDYITERSMGQKIIFKDISSVWAGGYEGMCRFMIYDIWEQCAEYDYVMRIDEDCILQKCVFNPFDQIQNAFTGYMASVFWAESHSETNATLPQFIQQLMGLDSVDFYNNRFPYTNVSVANVPYMRAIKELKIIAESELQRKNRWGDLPVIGAILNIYQNKEIKALTELSYYHASHNASINCQ